MDFDYIIIGSGFGGSVAAMRLAQKGYRVAVIEKGKRWYPSDFPSSNMFFYDYLWFPKLFLKGFQKLTLLKDAMILSGVGVGGGSLVYAANLYVPEDEFFSNEIMQKLGGKKSMMPFYRVAEKMLGTDLNPKITIGDKLLRRTASEFGTEHSFEHARAGIFFGEENKTVADPYFKGDGPKRMGCNFCGGCMVGCRYNAKNSLDKNYLYLAEKLGATVIPETEAVRITPLNEDGSEGYSVKTKKSTLPISFSSREYTSGGIVFAAGTLGTMDLLLRMKKKKYLKHLSPALGFQVRTNSESLLSVQSPGNNIDFSKGIAISSRVHVEPGTSIEAVNYPAGSNLMGMLLTVSTEDGGLIPRPIKFIFNALTHPFQFFKTIFPFGFARKNLILLVMQTRNNYFRLDMKRRLLFPFSMKLVSRMGKNNKIPSYIPVGYEFAKRLARRIEGKSRTALPEAALNISATAHILGGCCMAENRREGVIDTQNRVFGYQNMIVCDGSVIPANPGVNPSLSITAFAERAMSIIPAHQGKKPHIFGFEKNWDSAKWISRKRKSAQR
ncbi:MAG: GMC family oxidoreductase [Spirochaetia bacterium]|nr:GMC family oxidoreductase [Spirochaetia bacterium]